MTVSELLKRMASIYPGFTAAALEALGSVYRARLGKVEGPHLADAFTHVAANFNPTARKPFPIAKDFEEQLPSSSLHAKPDDSLDRWGPPIRSRMEARAKVIPEMIEAWTQRQGLKIEQARGWRVAAACGHEVHQIASQRGWSGRASDILLTAEQIKLCEDRAVSSERSLRFGPLPADREVWETQTAECRAAVKSGERPKRKGSIRKMGQQSQAAE